MTADEPLARREVVTRRVEYRLPVDLDGVEYRRVVEALDAVVRDRPGGASPVRVRVEDDAVVAYYEAIETVTGDVTRESGPIRVLRGRNVSLADALGLPGAEPVPTWDDLLRLVRRNTRIADVVIREQRLRGEVGEPVPVLLPSDWPRRLEQLLPSAGNQLALLGMVRRLVGDWVLTTQDVVDEVPIAQDRS